MIANLSRSPLSVAGPTTQRVALTALQDVAASLYADGVIPGSTRALN